jgi:lysozyme
MITYLKVSQVGLDFIAEWEGFSSTAYPDGGNGKYSIGYGTHIDTTAEKYLLTKTITRFEGTQLKKADIARLFEPVIKKWIKVQLNQNQHDALVSLLYNIGERCLHAGAVPTGLCNAINAKDENRIRAKWAEWRIITDKNGKKQVSNYLVQRRAAELALWFESVFTKRSGKYEPVRRNNENGTTISNSNGTITALAIVTIAGLAGFWAYRRGYLGKLMEFIKSLKKRK